MKDNLMRRDVGAFALMLTGLGSIIGSGWLFGAWRAAQLAGPGSLWAWIFGAIIVTLIALSYAELGAMFPEAGGMVRFGNYSHGTLVGFVAGWANWIAIVSVIPVEAEASVQYMASWKWEWAKSLFTQANLSHSGELSTAGLAVSAVLVLVYFLVNFWSVKLFSRSNSVITLFKLIVPLLTGLALIASGFHEENLSVGIHGAVNEGIDWAAVLMAVSTSGILFSFNGFQSPINFAGEARNPGRSIPLAVLGSIGLATIIYLVLELAYLCAVPSDMLSKAGWHGINFSSPFAELAMLFNLQWLAMLLYADAFISPSGTGITYTATTARMIYGMERNGSLPKIFGYIHPRWGTPRPAMILNLVVSYLFLFCFRDWGTLAEVISAATVISYLSGPISAATLRRTAPDLYRPLRIKGLSLISAIAFVMATELLYWSGWPLTGHIISLMLVALPIYFYFESKKNWVGFSRQLYSALWLIAYLPVIALISYAGSDQFHGKNYIPYGIDLVTVAIVGIVFYFWATNTGLSAPDTSTETESSAYLVQ